MLKTINRPLREQPELPSDAKASLWARIAVVSLMILCLAVAGMLSAMTAMRFAIRGQEIEVPDLAGMIQADAVRVLTPHGLGLELDRRRFSDRIPEGRILGQNPPPGARVKRDRSVRVVLSLGERQFPVPGISGSSFRSAQILLNQRGLSVGNAVYSHTGDGEPSTVVYQRPEAGDVSADDPAVNMLVSLGQIDQYYVMPDLTGQVAAALVIRLRAEGFRLGEITYTAQVGVPADRVVAQQPAAGHKVSKNEVINLEVSQ